MAQNEAATLAEQLRKTAAAAGSHVLEGAVPMGSTLTGPHFYLEVDAALELITSTRPRVLYLYESVLDLDDLLDDAREALGLEDDEEIPSRLRGAAEQLEKHDGEPCSTSVFLVVDSILHFTEASVSWMAEFESTLDELTSVAQESLNEERQRERDAESAHVDTLARRLLADPAFHFSKPSAAKRHLLATAMFPDEDSGLLHEVVDLAQRLHWLEQSGFHERRAN